MSEPQNFNKENYQFYFPVLGYFEGDRVIFMTDTGTEIRNDGKYIYNVATEEWATINTCPEELWEVLENLDLKVFMELVYRLSLVGKDEDDSNV